MLGFAPFEFVKRDSFGLVVGVGRPLLEYVLKEGYVLERKECGGASSEP